MNKKAVEGNYLFRNKKAVVNNFVKVLIWIALLVLLGFGLKVLLGRITSIG
tara:strand:- start:3708 stop:3860 length:153 start_codon:yes stop_codon:yes gene_type:complete